MGLRTGAEYLAGLRDDRKVYYDGRLIDDPTTEPGLRNTALTVAQYYDMQTNPDLQDLLTYETPDGDKAHLSFIEPRSIDDSAATRGSVRGVGRGDGWADGPGPRLHERLHDGRW